MILFYEVLQWLLKYHYNPTLYKFFYYSNNLNSPIQCIYSSDLVNHMGDDYYIVVSLVTTRDTLL